MDGFPRIDIGVGGAAVGAGDDVDAGGVHLGHQRHDEGFIFFGEAGAFVRLASCAADAAGVGGDDLWVDVFGQAVLGMIGGLDGCQRL